MPSWVLGPWGSGKTSFVNLTRLDLKDAGWTIVDFNPWMFSGAEQLVDSFIIELTAQLRVQSRFRDLADSLERYGEIFSSLGRLPVVGPWRPSRKRGGDGWESNPPRTPQQRPANGFEDRAFVVQRRPPAPAADRKRPQRIH